MEAVSASQRFYDRRAAIGAGIVDVLQRARAAYEAAVALNARHRAYVKNADANYSREAETTAYRAAAAAVSELGREMARLQVIVEGGA